MTRFVLIIVLLGVVLMPVVAEDIMPSWVTEGLSWSCAVNHAPGIVCEYNKKTGEYEVTGSPIGGWRIETGHGERIDGITDSKAIQLLVEGYLDMLDCDYTLDESNPPYEISEGVWFRDGVVNRLIYKIRIVSEWQTVSRDRYKEFQQEVADKREARISELRKYLNQ